MFRNFARHTALLENRCGRSLLSSRVIPIILVTWLVHIADVGSNVNPNIIAPEFIHRDSRKLSAEQAC